MLPRLADALRQRRSGYSAETDSARPSREEQLGAATSEKHEQRIRPARCIIETMIRRVLGLAIAFVVLTALFWAVEFFWPGSPAQPRGWRRRGFATDTAYWFVTSLATKPLAHLAVLVALVPVLLLLGHSLDRQAVLAGYGPLLRLPRWAQAVSIVFVGDLIGYGTHRIFHRERLWPFHAVHHSSEDLDWLSSVRLHPVNDIVSRICQAVPFVLLGFSPLVVASYLPFLTFYAIFEHANVSWDFGPLRYVLASPEFHRWHHTKAEEGLDKNFAGLFPIFDLLFGTFYMPRGKHPTEFGVDGVALPVGLWGQLTYPFRKRQSR